MHEDDPLTPFSQRTLTRSLEATCIFTHADELAQNRKDIGMLASDFAEGVTVALHAGCNLECEHCYRPPLANAREGTFRLTYSQIETALAEIDELQRGMQSLPDMKVYFTGGEPCMWQDNDKDLVDVLLLVANRYDSRPRFDTNGVLFANEGWCRSFLDRYFAAAQKPLKIIFSCDHFHRGSAKASPGFYSCDAQGKLPAVDQVLKYGQDKNCTDSLALEVMWVSATTDKHELPAGIRAAYPRVEFSVVPLLPAGAAASLADIAPRLRVLAEDGSPESDRAGLGCFLPHAVDMLRRKGKTEDEIGAMSNKDVFSTLSVCGSLPNPFFCWDADYYYCIPRLGEPEFRVAKIGELIAEVSRFQHSDIIGMRRRGILPHLEETVHPARLKECLQREHYLRYTGCSFCRCLVGAARD